MYEIVFVRWVDSVIVDDPLVKLSKQFWGRNALLWFDKGEWTDRNLIDGALIKEESSTILSDIKEGKLSWVQMNNLLLQELQWKVDKLVYFYCSPGERICREAYAKKIPEYIADANDVSIRVEHLPFTKTVSFLEDKTRLWSSCLIEAEKVAYNEGIYGKNYPKSVDDVIDLWISVTWTDFEECLEKWSSRLWIQQTMKQGNQYFWVTHIPSYVIIDPVQKSRIMVPGLYKTSEIDMLSDKFASKK